MRYMNITLQWSTSAIIDGIEIGIPEPEAFALHKLIVMGLRDDKENPTKDLEAARGL